MPLVFVHGVNVRDGDRYREGVRSQRELFARAGLRGLAEDPVVTHPYWGGLAANPRWNNASVPDGDYESFGAEDDVAATLEESVSSWPRDNPIIAIAREDFPNAVDVLWTLVPEEEASPELAEMGARTVAYAEANRNPVWLQSVANDQQFLTQLQINVEAWQPTGAAAGTASDDAWESFGLSDVWDSVREGARRLAGLPGRAAGAAVVAVSRSKVHGHVARFMGDIFVYLDKRGDRAQPGPIPRNVIDAIESADAARTPNDPHVVVVCHSMGGNIVYDVLSHYRPDLAVDVFVTVGSQVGMFEEFKVFHNSDDAVPAQRGDRVAKPANIAHWVNVFDKQDILSFATGRVFTDVTDFEYSTGASVLGAHTSYFKRPSFHRRLNERLTEKLQP